MTESMPFHFINRTESTVCGHNVYKASSLM